MQHKELTIVRVADIEDIQPDDRYVMITRLGENNEPVEEGVLNIRDGVFMIDQQYAFQCAPMGDTEESMTVIRMTIPTGTKVVDGYREVWNSLQILGYNPAKVCLAMGFLEIFDWSCIGCQGSMSGCDVCKQSILDEP